mgnify:CR=1 FL=1
MFFQEGPGVRNTQYTDSGVKLLNVANLVDGKIDLSTSDRYISEEEAYGKYAHFLVEDGDFIIASSGIKVEYFEKKMGFVSANQLPLCMNTSTIRFRTLDENVLNIRYFMYYLKSESFKLQLEKQITGSAQLNFGPSHLKKMYVPVVGLESQKAICKKLDKINRVLELKRNQIDELDTLIKARFVEMFGDPVSNPFNYDKVRLSQIADIKIGPFGSLLHKEDYIENGHPLVNPSHIVDSKISVDNKLTISNEKYEELGAYKLQIGDVVMGRRGEMGRCAVVLEDGLLCGTGSILIRPTQNVTADFIQKIISFPSFKKTIEDMAVGQTMPNLNVPIVSNFEIIHPPVEVQKSYYDFVTQVDKLKVEVQSIFLNCGSRSIFRYAQSIKGCKIEKYERRCSFDTKRECHRGNEKKWWICYLSTIKSDC